MTTASCLDEKSQSLSLVIPSIYSVDSSLAPSPTGILGSSRSPTDTASTTSIPPLNVTFAPLPKLAPRKRRSATPLGMAARGQLMRRRRYIDDAEMTPTYGSSPMWTEEELEQHHLAQSDEGRRRRRRSTEDEEEDAFVVFGKLVKGASQRIWRKVSSKDLPKQTEKQSDGEGNKSLSTPKIIGEKDEELKSNLTSSKETEQRQILATITSNNREDGPGTNSSEDERLLSVGQTETIVDGQTKHL